MYGRLVWLRLRAYLRASGDLVLRHWQWFLLAGLVVPGPPVVAVFLNAASFLGAVVSAGLGLVPRFLLAMTIDLAALLWILPQRHALSGGVFMRYVAALPLPRGVRFRVEATLLTVANSPILVSAGIAAAHMLASPNRLYVLCCFLVLLCLAAIAQHSVLCRRPIVLLGVVLGDGALAAALAAAPIPGMQWLLLAAALGSGVLGVLADRRLGQFQTTRRPGLAEGPLRRSLRVLGRRAPSLLVQCKAVAEHPLQAACRIGAAIALAVGADRLIAIFAFDARALPTVILAMAAIGLLLAGIYRTLYEAHRAMATYLAALPLPPRYWLKRDTAFVLLLGAVPLIILLSPQVLHGLLSLLVLIGLAAAYQCLLALLRWPVIHGGRRSLLYGVLLAAAWSGAAIAAVTR